MVFTDKRYIIELEGKLFFADHFSHMFFTHCGEHIHYLGDFEESFKKYKVIELENFKEFYKLHQ